MAEALLELLVPYFEHRSAPSSDDPIVTEYLEKLTTLPLSSLNTTEPQSLAQSTHTVLLSLQSLSTRSHKSVVASSDHLSSLRTVLPILAKSTADLRDVIPKLDDEAVRFSETYNKNAENAVLDRRRKALLLSRNVDRLTDVLDLPTLLSSAISSSGVSTSSSGTTSSSATVNYASALDLNAHIRRLHTLYPSSNLISSVTEQAEEAMQSMTMNLVASLKTQGVKLAAAMRTIGWLRRVAPELDAMGSQPGSNREGSLGALFLVCRLANLLAMLGALEPLRDLADQEIKARVSLSRNDSSTLWSGGQQTERYLKRYIEIFREQSFAIVSMFRSIFPAGGENDVKGGRQPATQIQDPLQTLPSALATFPSHLIEILLATLKKYLPNVQDRSSRDSLLTQVLYCAGVSED